MLLLFFNTSLICFLYIYIGLCHSTTGDKKQQNPPPSKSEHDHVLEHSLHQLLREVHHKNTHHPFPHPATGPLGPSKKRMMAGKFCLINIKCYYYLHTVWRYSLLS